MSQNPVPNYDTSYLSLDEVADGKVRYVIFSDGEERNFDPPLTEQEFAEFVKRRAAQ